MQLIPEAGLKDLICKAPKFPRPLLGSASLAFFAADAKYEQENGGRGTLFGMPLRVLHHFFGADWIDQHLYKAGPLKPPSRFVDPEGSWRAGLQAYELAEMLFNLQDIENFGSILQRLKVGQIDAVIAELEVARFLRVHEENFRFVEPIGNLGSDFDIVVLRDEITICCEAKTKLTKQELSSKSIYNSLDQARRQLPKDRPGLIFLRVPDTSNEAESLSRLEVFTSAARRLLRHTTRIVGVIILLRQHFEAGKYKAAHPLSRRVMNQHSRFSSTLTNNLARDVIMPDWWFSFNVLFNRFSEEELFGFWIDIARQEMMAKPDTSVF